MGAWTGVLTAGRTTEGLLLGEHGGDMLCPEEDLNLLIMGWGHQKKKKKGEREKKETKSINWSNQTVSEKLYILLIISGYFFRVNGNSRMWNRRLRKSDRKKLRKKEQAIRNSEWEKEYILLTINGHFSVVQGEWL